MLDHRSEALNVSFGKFCSALFSMIGNVGTRATTIVNPESNNPVASKIRLFGNSLLGPIKKLHTPQLTKPKVTRFI